MTTLTTGYGAAAHAALADLVAAAKVTDSMAPVTVLVPTDLCGVIVRRRLARGVAGRPGVAALTVLTVDRLAELWAAPLMAAQGRQPLTDPVLAAACRRALAEAPGQFQTVADHPATVRALAVAYRQLREVDVAGLGAIGSGGPLAADLVRVHRLVRAHAARWYDVTDLRGAAVEVLRSRPALAAERGSIVLFLPQELTPTAAAFVATLAATQSVTTICGRTGDPVADAPITGPTMSTADATAMDAAAAGGNGPGDTPTPPRADRVLHASDADDEVRAVIRELRATLRTTAPDRVAVLYCAAKPYARLLAEQADAAGLIWNGPGVRPTIECAYARLLRDLLPLGERNWRRDEVLAWMSIAPIRLPGTDRTLPVARWERVTRASGVVAGDDWDRMGDYAARLAAKAKEATASGADGRGEALLREAAEVDECQQFLSYLRHWWTGLSTSRSWGGLADVAHHAYDQLVGDLAEQPWLPPAEARAITRVRGILASLPQLAELEEHADIHALASTLELVLADDRGRHGRFGDGVLIAPLSAAVGLDCDRVFIVGASDDLLPGLSTEDPLLPERIRTRVPGQLPTAGDRVARTHRHFLAACAAGPTTVSFARGDLRKTRQRLPSRWLMPSLRALADGPAAPTDWQRLDGQRIVGVPSYHHGLCTTDRLATAQEWRTRAVTAARAAGQRPESAFDDPVLRAAGDLRAGRANPLLSRYDGDLTSADVPDPTATVVSPTTLESWTRCPHAYFMRRLLGVEPVIAPEEILTASPLETGTLIHEALDEFFAEQQAAGAVPGPGQQWTTAQHARLRAITEGRADGLVRAGVAGHQLLWRQELRRILDDLAHLLHDDDALRTDGSRRQVRSELAFGWHDAEPVTFTLPDGRTVRFRGSADRVDTDGDAIVVVDYKSGSATSFLKLGESDPTGAGEKLQLPVYAAAARQALGRPDTPVTAEYWFLRKHRGHRVRLPLTEAVHRRFVTDLATIVDGIGGGLYPHRPPETDGFGGYIPCRYCDPDGLGTADHRQRWRRHRADPRLRRYLDLIGDSTDDG
ncbi:PD-(D/E)XK nuclease family protein [Pilimelia columellifera]|uniref:PD-(D/E)XK endonuclease-like domain-containing protein n=1 Tax=Pilimelia columellifera subsp. columellifera TaxID=706583 RepID=A0ABN3NQF9_9ACTN